MDSSILYKTKLILFHMQYKTSYFIFSDSLVICIRGSFVISYALSALFDVCVLGEKFN